MSFVVFRLIFIDITFPFCLKRMPTKSLKCEKCLALKIFWCRRACIRSNFLIKIKLYFAQKSYTDTFIFNVLLFLFSFTQVWCFSTEQLNHVTTTMKTFLQLVSEQKKQQNFTRRRSKLTEQGKKSTAFILLRCELVARYIHNALYTTAKVILH